MNTGPTPEDAERTRLWRKWVDLVFDEVAKSLGPFSSKGAQRTMGDFVVSVEASEKMGYAQLWVALNNKFPQMLTAPTAYVQWNSTTPASAASTIIGLCDRLKSEPGYIWTKRSGG